MEQITDGLWAFLALITLLCFIYWLSKIQHIGEARNLIDIGQEKFADIKYSYQQGDYYYFLILENFNVKNNKKWPPTYYKIHKKDLWINDCAALKGKICKPGHYKFMICAISKKSVNIYFIHP